MKQTLTQVQEEAIQYFNSRKWSSDRNRRAVRKASRMVRSYCEAQGYTDSETTQCIRDMFDMARLERDAT